jgi:hypothetical protein
VDGPPLASRACVLRIACIHMSGLFVRLA